MGFLFLVLYPPPPSARRPPVLLLTHTHTHTHSHSHSLTHTHSLTHSLTHSPSLTHPLTHLHTHSLNHSLTQSLTHSLHSLTPSLTHSLTLTHSHSLMCLRGCTPWRPLVSASFAWQAWDNVHCQGVGCTPRGSAGVPGSPPLLRGRRGTMCTAKRSDVRPGVPLASLGLRLFCVAGVGQCALPRGRMYAPGFRWRPWVSASFAWQAWDNVHCQGVGCTPRGSAGVPWSPPLLRGRRGTMCTPWQVGLRLFCVAGVGQCALPRGRMYAPGFRWRPWVSASFAWQAWDNVHCQGVGCTPRGSAGVPGSPPLLRGRRGTMCTAKGSDVRPGVPLASLGLRLFCVAGVGQCALPRGRMYAPGFRWRPWVSASFAWQAWDNVHCQGVGCTPRGSAGVPGSPPLLSLHTDTRWFRVASLSFFLVRMEMGLRHLTPRHMHTRYKVYVSRLLLRSYDFKRK